MLAAIGAARSAPNRLKTRMGHAKECQLLFRPFVDIASATLRPTRGNVGPLAHIYVYSVEHHTVRERGGARPSTVVQDHRHIVWPDTFTESPDDTLFMSWFDPQSPIAPPARHKPSAGSSIPASTRADPCCGPSCAFAVNRWRSER